MNKTLKFEVDSAQFELQKSGANQKKYRCEKFCADVTAFIYSLDRKSSNQFQRKHTKGRIGSRTRNYLAKTIR